MGKALELLTGFATAPGTTATALTMAAGNSATVRAAAPGSVINLLSAWADVQGAGTLRIRSSLLHDATQGIRLDTVVSDLAPLLPLGIRQPLRGNDTLTIDITGSSTAGDIETACLLVSYQDLPGADAHLIGEAELLSRARHIFTVENTLSLGTGGGYSGEEAINAEFDLGKANTEYALVGYLVDAECACVRWRGADTANLGVGGPGADDRRELTAWWFVWLSRQQRLPLVPVFNFTNKGGILLDGAQDENGADVTVTSIFVELAPPATT